MSSVEINTDKPKAHLHTSKPVHVDGDGVAPSDMATIKDVSHSHHLSFTDDKNNPTDMKSAFIEEDADAERGDLTSSSQDTGVAHTGSKRSISRYFSKWKIFAQVFVWLLFTGYVALILAGLIPRR